MAEAHRDQRLQAALCLPGLYLITASVPFQTEARRHTLYLEGRHYPEDGEGRSRALLGKESTSMERISG